MARQVNLTVQCAGKTLAPGQDFRALLLHQTLFDHHSLSLVVPFDSVEGSNTAFLTQAPGRFLGQPVAVSVAPNQAFALEKIKETGFDFKGLVTEMGTTKDSDGDSSITVQGYSRCCLLAEGLQKRTFVNQTLQVIFETVLAPYGSNVLATDIKPQHKAKIAYVAQYKETNYAFLSRLAAEYGEWFFYDGLTLRLGPLAQGSEIDFVADGVHNTFHLGMSLNSTKVKLYDYNYRQHQHFTASTDTQSLPAASQHPFVKLAIEQSKQVFQQESQVLAEVSVESGGELEDEASAFNAQRVADLVALQGGSDNPSLQLGRVMRVRGLGLGQSSTEQTDFGTYRLVEITHHLDAEGNYSNTFTAIPHVLEVPPLNPAYAPPAGAQELAEVIDVADPDRLGRVRVRYYWPVAKPEQAETPWLRTLTSYSGDGKGHLFVPEVGSQVLVGYEQGLAEFPVVLGNLFHAQNPQQASYTRPDNQLKGLQTAGGNKIVMSDVAGAQTILISNSNKKGTSIAISFEGDGSISLTTNGPINLTSGDTISLEAKKNIALRAGGDITLAADKNILAETKDESINLRARKELLLTATDDNLTLEAASKKLLAKSADNVEISASAVAKIMGADIKWSKP